DVLDSLRDLISRAGLGSLEQHVLEDVRKAGAKMFTLGRAAGCAPRLHTGHRRAAIFLHDQGQAVRKRPPLSRVWRKTDCWRRHRRGSLEVCAVKHERKTPPCSDGGSTGLWG